VHFAGALSPDRIADLMCAADVFCLASDREGCPNVVREALACGTPVVATRVGAVPELIPNSRYGVTVSPGDDAALQRALEFALSRTWDRKAIADWGASRTWDNVADEVFMQMQATLRR
jgi:teichuronic acid biosynthesis glycosyltransferase TuaC